MQRKHIFLTVLLTFFTVNGLTQNLDNQLPKLSDDEIKYYTIGSMSIEEIDPETPGNVNFERELFTPIFKGADAVTNLSRIVAVGKEIWQIVEANQPVSAYKIEAASAIPQGIEHWTELGTWAAPEVRAFKVSYVNLFGSEVVNLRFKVLYTPKGSHKGVGQYLTNMTIVPSNLTVSWGYKFNALGKIANVTNAGTNKSPIAAAELHMNWKVETVLKDDESTEVFYVKGDGSFKQL